MPKHDRRRLWRIPLLALGLLPVLGGAPIRRTGGPSDIAEAAPARAALDYPIVYVRQPRLGDETQIVWPEVFQPGRAQMGSDLMLLHPDGREEVLVPGGVGAVTDPYISLDGRSVYYSYFHDLRPEALNPQRGYLPLQGADIYRVDLVTRQIRRLTFQEFSPNTAAGRWLEGHPADAPESYNRLGYGILNLGPAPLPGGQVIFVSSRNGLLPNKSGTLPGLQLYVMDEDGANVTAIAPMTNSSAMHPTPLRDGRVAFSSYEGQGLRDDRLWGIWAVWPDGRIWEPVVSAFKRDQAFHFMTQLSNDDLVVEDYYNGSNAGFGALYRLPVSAPGGGPRFYGPRPDQNPAIQQTNALGMLEPFRMAFTPKGMVSLTPFTHADDAPAPMGANGRRVGKFTHPSGAPRDDLLVVWSPGSVNLSGADEGEAAIDSGIYLMPESRPITSPAGLLLVKDDPAYNEAWPRAAVSYGAVHHGDLGPYHFPWLPNDGVEHATLPAGTPYGLVGTSSFLNRESAPGFAAADSGFDGLDAFNSSDPAQSSNWRWQGADAGRYDDDDVYAVRLVAQEPSSDRAFGPQAGQHFFNHVNERLRILGEIPLRKTGPDGRVLRDQTGQPDTSFLARIPADTPFTFQTLDRNGMVLNMAQTWHQVRPGEIRADCGGCHAHSRRPVYLAQTAASRPDYQPWDLTASRPLLSRDASGQPTLRQVEGGAVNVEFHRDVRPILSAHCVACHSQKAADPPGRLVLDDLAPVAGPPGSGLRFPGDYARLCYDPTAQWGYPPLAAAGKTPRWRQTNASRYVRVFQSRRSLLIWKVFGRRMDGWTNEDHPTEARPGDLSSLLPGIDPNLVDLDYSGSIMPPPGSGVPPLSAEQKLTLARWVDLGCPIDGVGAQDAPDAAEAGPGGDTAPPAPHPYGWYLDEVRPTLTVSAPRAGASEEVLRTIRIGFTDAYSGIQADSLSVRLDQPLMGRPPGAELADLAQPAGEGIVLIPIPQGLSGAHRATLTVTVADRQGNQTRQTVTFSIRAHKAYLPRLGR